jgi:hypothetical protein
MVRSKRKGRVELNKDILAKYEGFYKDGSGGVFQVAADDFKELVRRIEYLEEQRNFWLKRCEILEEEIIYFPSEKLDELIERYEKALNSIADPKKLFSIDEAMHVASEALKRDKKSTIDTFDFDVNDF